MNSKENNTQFTPLLALVDAIPVVLFGIAAILLGVKVRSVVFFAGALLCFLAGFGKVLWKFLIALTGKDVGGKSTSEVVCPHVWTNYPRGRFFTEGDGMYLAPEDRVTIW